MARLIDADALTKRVTRLASDNFFSDEVAWNMRDLIETTPTVEALPIEAIEKEIRRVEADAHREPESIWSSRNEFMHRLAEDWKYLLILMKEDE